MSCNCDNTTGTGNGVSCPCDSFEHPADLKISAGLTDLPRQLGGFPEFRRAMLRAVREKAPLDQWKARQPADMGLMLLEMWAYLCDSLCFYDKVISQEEYLATALRRPSLRRLVALLGYLPRPAVGSTVVLTALADGRELVNLPAGTSFRSGAFDGNPPQVFELDKAAVIHPQANQWEIKAPHRGVTTVAGQSAFLLQPAQGDLSSRAALLYNHSAPNASEGCWINSGSDYTGRDGGRYTRIQLVANTSLPANSPLGDLQVRIALHSEGIMETGLSPAPVHIAAGQKRQVRQQSNTPYILLSHIQPSIRKGQFLLIGKQKDIRAFQVVHTENAFVSRGGEQTVTLDTRQFTLPGIQEQVTQIWLDRFIDMPGETTPWLDDPADFLVWFNLQPAGQVTDEASLLLYPSDPLDLTEPAEPPFGGYLPSKFALVDRNRQAAIITGTLDLSNDRLRPDQGQQWAQPLTNPVTLFGNLLQASRGETVPSEIMGSGDSSQVNQSFALKKNPLTYFPAASAGNDQGVENTLKVYVDNVRWKEVPSFYRRGPFEEIYIVRQNDAGESQVMFGDGIRGKRLPGGTDNVTASYRYGAGAAEPPPGLVNQTGSPVSGLRSVNNPAAAFGGDDQAPASRIRRNAPRSVLTLGRAVSIPDMEAIVAAVPGVRVVQGLWHWHERRQSPVALIWYAGDPGLETRISERLHDVTDPETPVEASPATASHFTLRLDLELDPGYVPGPVISRVITLLGAKGDGRLSPEQVGIGKPVFRSQIFEWVLSVEGVLAVRNMLWNGQPFTDYYIAGVPGAYFDAGDAGIFVNGINS